MTSRTLPTALLLVAPLTPVTAQTGLESPETFLGYELGSRFTPHHRVVSYLEHVAAHAPHVELRQYGSTYEGRPLLLAIISSPDNMRRLDQIRTDNLRRAGLLDGTPSGAPTALVWLSYNVHGNESVSTEASLATLYDLADPTDDRTRAWLTNTVVIIDPAINPDGRDRYVNWFTQVAGARVNATPVAREHREPWPGGRTNHYMFDLNRDWAWLTQKESLERIAAYREWLPHIHADFHEQSVNSPYYFAPAAEPYHQVITDWQRQFQQTIGRNHMKYFDANGWLYFTREVFDLLYPGYGDTYPTFNGGIGMTYEQAGGGRAGLAIERADGDTLTLHERIAHHHTTGLSTVEIASQHADRLVAEFAQFFRRAQTDPPGEYKTYVVKGDNGKDKLDALRHLLDRHDIQYGRTGRARSARAFHYMTDRVATARVEPGDLIISAHQPQGVLVKVLFEPRAAIADSVTYDITAWSLPYAHGLNVLGLAERIDPIPWVDSALSADDGELPDRAYAFLAEWKSVADIRVLTALLTKGLKVRAAHEPFELDGRTFDRGTLIITRTGNERLGEAFGRTVLETVAAVGQQVTPTTTGGVTQGRDFGSSRVRYLDPPAVAVLAGPGTSSSAVGEIWHFFDQQVAYPVTLLNTTDVARTDLAAFDVLILPNGSYNETFGEDALGELIDWVRAGGRLIALERAVRFLVGKESFAIERVTEDDDGDAEEDASAAESLKKYGERRRVATNENVPGAIYRLEIDNTHPLAFGYPDYYYTLKRSSERYAFLKDHWNVGVIRDNGYVSGFVGSDAREQLKEVLVFGVQEMGGGTVVYMADNPLFRAFWEGGKVLFANAVFIVGQ